MIPQYRWNDTKSHNVQHFVFLSCPNLLCTSFHILRHARTETFSVGTPQVWCPDLYLVMFAVCAYCLDCFFCSYIIGRAAAEGPAESPTSGMPLQRKDTKETPVLLRCVRLEKHLSQQSWPYFFVCPLSTPSWPPPSPPSPCVLTCPPHPPSSSLRLSCFLLVTPDVICGFEVEISIIFSR